MDWIGLDWTGLDWTGLDSEWTRNGLGMDRTQNGLRSLVYTGLCDN
jgi:hypothetical protein